MDDEVRVVEVWGYEGIETVLIQTLVNENGFLEDFSLNENNELFRFGVEYLPY